ncbi:MAG: hypothetical protein B0D92_04580 [Spirochaeta sp. LUC14_002_19_P3]|nr:MAG: hypothetical protein B0D92_04580 [Spirochaeta sp. LUC14_002_19_P3]
MSIKTNSNTTPSSKLIAAIRENSTPIHPIPTGMKEKLHPQKGIHAVLFDIYGTLLVCGIGDIGVSSPGTRSENLQLLLNNSGYPCTLPEKDIPGLLAKVIREHHKRLREAGTDYPEVDIREIWAEVLSFLWEQGHLAKKPDEAGIELLALRYEMQVNPVWTMPHFPELIPVLLRSGMKLGIVSNAQFYTPLILEALSDSPLGELGFSPHLCAWSYQQRRAKPSVNLFSAPLQALASMGISPRETLYVGNDMNNDIAAASVAGCRTCLFAGDKRSLKLEIKDFTKAAEPDIIISCLSQLNSLIDKEEKYEK